MVPPASISITTTRRAGTPSACTRSYGTIAIGVAVLIVICIAALSAPLQ